MGLTRVSSRKFNKPLAINRFVSSAFKLRSAAQFARISMILCLCSPVSSTCNKYQPFTIIRFLSFFLSHSQRARETLSHSHNCISIWDSITRTYSKTKQWKLEFRFDYLNCIFEMVFCHHTWPLTHTTVPIIKITFIYNLSILLRLENIWVLEIFVCKCSMQNHY